MITHSILYTRTLAASVPRPPDKAMQDWISAMCYLPTVFFKWGSCLPAGRRGTSPRMFKVVKVILIAFALLTLYCTTGQTQSSTKQLVTYTLQAPEQVQAGKPFSVEVVFDVEDDWYIYAPTGSNSAQGMIETKVTFTLPEGVKRSGKMEIPEAVYKNGYEVLEGKNVAMRQALTAAKPGSYAIKGKIIYQSCSTDVCMPPVTEEFVTTIHTN